MVLWPTRSEARNSSWDKPAGVLFETLYAEKVPHIDLMKRIRAIPDFEAAVYRDDIHPTPTGQRLVAGAVLQLAVQAVRDSQ